MNTFLQKIKLLVLVFIGAFFCLPDFVYAGETAPLPAYEQLSERTSLTKKERKRQLRFQKRLEKIKSKLQEKCNCSATPPDDPQASVNKDRQMTLIGVFLMATGLAAMIALFTISATTLIGWKILAGVVMIVGDTLVCEYANVCILRAFYQALSFFWWF